MGYRYFRRLQRRYSPSGEAQGQEQRPESTERLEASSSKEEQNGKVPADASKQPASLQTPVTCINLLRCNMQVVSWLQTWRWTGFASARRAFWWHLLWERVIVDIH